MCKKYQVLLGYTIVAHRKSKGLSQKELAKRIKISPSAINQIEKGKKSPSLKTWIKLGIVLDIHLGRWGCEVNKFFKDKVIPYRRKALYKKTANGLIFDGFGDELTEKEIGQWSHN